MCSMLCTHPHTHPHTHKHTHSQTERERERDIHTHTQTHIGGEAERLERRGIDKKGPSTSFVKLSLFIFYVCFLSLPVFYLYLARSFNWFQSFLFFCFLFSLPYLLFFCVFLSSLCQFHSCKVFPCFFLFIASF